MSVDADTQHNKLEVRGAPPPGLRAVLSQVRAAAEGETVSFATLLEKIGRQSFSAILLVIGLLIVSPLSGIPGLPAVFGLVVVIVTLQALVRRETLWLPRKLTDIEVRTDRLHRALDKLEGPARWLDRHGGQRFTILASAPLSSIAYLTIMLVALTWPPMSLIPFSATSTAVGVTLIAAGLMLRDGLFILCGYLLLGLLYGGGAAVLMGLF